MTADTDAITAVLGRYEDAANRSDTDAIVALCTPDAVLMAQNSPASVGIDAVRAAYAGMAQAITLDIRFTVAEIRQVASDWAFLRSTSAGTIKLHATGQTVPEANQERFVFQKLGGEWKIARYAFSITAPAG